jgi:peptide alpha-N-acetyltransferase
MILETYQGEHELQEMRDLMEKDLSEPYSIYTYRYFLIPNPELSILIRENGKLIGVIVGKLQMHTGHYGQNTSRGYIAMLAVDRSQRGNGLGSKLVIELINRLQSMDADEVVLETEITNKAALKLYERLGFIRDKKLPQYYMNRVDAYRLKLYLK